MINFWKTEKIRLREITAEDTLLFINADGDYDTETAAKYDYMDFPLSKENIAARISGLQSNSKSSDDFTFVIETHSHKPVGRITVFDCDRRNGTFKYGIFILEEYRGGGYASEAVKTMLDYYFNELRYNKSNVYIYDYNEASRKFHEKLGFVEEGRLRQMSYSGGKYHDTVYYGILRDEFNQLYKQIQM